MEWANLLHNLIHPIAMKKKNHETTKIPLLQSNLPPFMWTSDHQESFDRLKEVLVSPPILAYPNYT